MLFVLGKNQLKMYSCRRFIIHKRIFQSADGTTRAWGLGARVRRRNLNQRPGFFLCFSDSRCVSDEQRPLSSPEDTGLRVEE